MGVSIKAGCASKATGVIAAERTPDHGPSKERPHTHVQDEIGVVNHADYYLQDRGTPPRRHAAQMYLQTPTL